MMYTMKRGRDIIKLDTVTGNITGGTYGMRDVIKSEFDGARWDASIKAWHVDNLSEIIDEYKDRLHRLYWLETVEEPKQTTKDMFVARVNRVCPKCGTYCYGDCSFS